MLLPAQLRFVQDEMDCLQKDKHNELEEVQEDLRLAQEEVLMVQQAAEEEAAERENDIASLQEELCRLKAELQRLHMTAQEYELEVTTLRVELQRLHMAVQEYPLEVSTLKAESSTRNRHQDSNLSGRSERFCWLPWKPQLLLCCHGNTADPPTWSMKS